MRYSSYWSSTLERTNEGEEEEEVGISYGGHSIGRVGMRVSSPFPSARYGGHSTGRVCNAVFMLYVTMAIALD